MDINLDGKRDYDKACQENRDPNNMHRIERQAKELASYKRCNHPGPSVRLREQAELERLWGHVLKVIGTCERSFGYEVDAGNLTCEMKDVLRAASAALQPCIGKAAAKYMECRSESDRLFDDEYKNAGLPPIQEGSEA